MTQNQKIALLRELITLCPRARNDIKRELKSTLDYATRCDIEINEEILLRRKGIIELHIGCTTGDMLQEEESE